MPSVGAVGPGPASSSPVPDWFRSSTDTGPIPPTPPPPTGSLIDRLVVDPVTSAVLETVGGPRTDVPHPQPRPVESFLPEAETEAAFAAAATPSPQPQPQPQPLPRVADEFTESAMRAHSPMAVDTAPPGPLVPPAPAPPIVPQYAELLDRAHAELGPNPRERLEQVPSLHAQKVALAALTRLSQHLARNKGFIMQPERAALQDMVSSELLQPHALSAPLSRELAEKARMLWAWDEDVAGIGRPGYVPQFRGTPQPDGEQVGTTAADRVVARALLEKLQEARPDPRPLGQRMIADPINRDTWNVLVGLAGGAELVLNVALPAGAAKIAAMHTTEPAEQFFEQMIGEIAPRTPGGAGDILTDPALFAERLSEMTPYMAGAVATGASSLGAAGVFSFTALVEGGGAYQRARDAGLGDKAVLVGVGVGIVNGALETATTMFKVRLLTGRSAFVGRVTKRLEQWATKNALTKITAGALGEILQESAQTLSEEGAITWAGGTPSPDIWAQLAEVAVVSGAMGGLFGGAGALRGDVAGQQPQALPAEAMPAPEGPPVGLAPVAEPVTTLAPTAPPTAPVGPELGPPAPVVTEQAPPPPAQPAVAPAPVAGAEPTGEAETIAQAAPVEPREAAGEAAEGAVQTIAGTMTLEEFEQKGYEPDEVTQADWVSLQRAYRRGLGQSEESGTRAAPFSDYEEYHREAVKKAIEGGDVVDERVLADYPDLAAAETRERPAAEPPPEEKAAPAVTPTKPAPRRGRHGRAAAAAREAAEVEQAKLKAEQAETAKPRVARKNVNGWRITKEDIHYVVRNPATGEEAYRSGKIARAIEVANQSAPEPAAPAVTPAERIAKRAVEKKAKRKAKKEKPEWRVTIEEMIGVAPGRQPQAVERFFTVRAATEQAARKAVTGKIVRVEKVSTAAAPAPIVRGGPDARIAARAKKRLAEREAKKAKIIPVSRIEGGTGLEFLNADLAKEAIDDWHEGRLYIDGNGNWHRRPAVVSGPPDPYGPPGWKRKSGKGPIATYNKELKARGVTVEELQQAAEPLRAEDAKRKAEEDKARAEKEAADAAQLASARGTWSDVAAEWEKWKSAHPEEARGYKGAPGVKATPSRAGKVGATPAAVEKIRERAKTPPDVMADFSEERLGSLSPRQTKELAAAKKLLKRFINEVPEAAIDPAFTVKGEGANMRLVFADGFKFEFLPGDLGFAAEDLKPGMKVGVDLEQLGVNQAKKIQVAEKQAKAAQPAQPAEKAKPAEAETEAAKAQREAGEAETTEELAGGLGGVDILRPRKRARADRVPEAMRAPSEEAERRLQGAHGTKQGGIIAAAKRAVADAFHVATRPFRHIPGTGEYDTARELLRLYKEITPRETDEVSRTIGAILDPLGPEQYRLFERHEVIANLAESVERGEPLRFGFESLREVNDYLKVLGDLVNKTPEVKKAVETRRKIVKELTGQLVEEGLLQAESVEQSEAYFHQQVLAYAQAQRFSAGKTGRPRKRAFQKKRVTGAEEFSEQYDYNTDYIEAEATWMTEARIELAKKRWLDQVGKQYDKMAEFRKQATASDRNVDSVISEAGYQKWQPVPGNVFFRALSIPEKVMEQLQAGVLAGTELNEEHVRTLLAVGGQRAAMALPVPLVKQLNSMEKPKPAGPVGMLSRDLMRAWKIYTLMNPKRAISYNLRNVSGDIDPVIAGAPGALKYVPKASAELGKMAQEHLALSGDLRDARDLGVISASMTAQDIPDLQDLETFKRFYKNAGHKPPNFVERYFKTVKKYSTYRENMLRYAAYLYYLDQLRAGTLQHYGGASKRTVRNIQATLGVKVAAAHLSRNLLGDYGNLTEMGNWLRTYAIPFFSWMEINTKRLPVIAWNGVQSGYLKTGRGVAAATLWSAIATARIGLLYGLFAMWNRLRFPDEEDQLGPYERANPHVILGRNDDGSVMIFRNIGAFGDVLEWIGINDLISLYPQYQKGQITTGDLATEMAKAPLNKIVGGFRPDVKALFEIAAGQSYFPDATRPRPRDRGEIAAGVFGLHEEYRELKGQLLKTGERARPHYLQRLIGVTDLRRNALYEIYDLREKYLKKEGKARPTVWGASPFKPLREAAMANDKDAFLEARRAYLKAGKTWRNFRASLRYLDPIAARLNRRDERKFQQEFLDSIGRQKLKVARDYAAQLKERLALWWREAAAPE